LARLRTRDRLSSYRSALEREGDVSVGAFARRHWFRRVLLGGLGVLLLAGAAWTWYSLQPHDEGVGLGGRYTVALQCSLCAHRGEAAVGHDQKFPLKCPACGKRTWWPLWRCQVCGEEFLVRPGVSEVCCPECGSVSVGTAVRTPLEEPEP